MILNTLPYRALGEYPVTHGDAMGYEFVALSGRKHQIADNHYYELLITNYLFCTYRASYQINQIHPFLVSLLLFRFICAFRVQNSPSAPLRLCV